MMTIDSTDTTGINCFSIIFNKKVKDLLTLVAAGQRRAAQGCQDSSRNNNSRLFRDGRLALVVVGSIHIRLLDQSTSLAIREYYGLTICPDTMTKERVRYRMDSV